MNKKGKFYILNWIFSYGSASSNRLLAYANSAAELGYDVEIVAFLRLDLRNCQPRNGVIIRGLRPCKVESKVFSKLIFLHHDLVLACRCEERRQIAVVWSC